ncbi:hypothetical protein CSC3H3_13105 [Thalassospira marina]|uniref:DUF4197 domain-containing protein n=2 Tax=Thalassospira marina TaxID=2048283 RepID=A0ABM6QAG9_9PROT|nr:hypothetical protein CSC3H3_13105 [Thalassospira marina]
MVFSVPSIHPEPSFMSLSSSKIIVAASLAVMGAGIFAVSQPAQAENSFFSSAKKALGTVMGGESSGSGTSGNNATSSGSTTGTQNSAISGLSQGVVDDGLRQALDKGIGTVTAMLGKKDGFNTDPVAHIPLPDTVKRAQTLLNKAGMGSYGDEIELRMNRAAESAMDNAGNILVDAVKKMTVADAKAILQGPDDAATRYLQKVSGTQIADDMRPVMNDALSDTGALQLYDQMLGQYDSLPMMPDIKTSLTDYATDAAMKGLFHYLAQQEGEIRNNPGQWTTDVLKKVFSAAQ